MIKLLVLASLYAVVKFQGLFKILPLLTLLGVGVKTYLRDKKLKQKEIKRRAQFIAFNRIHKNQSLDKRPFIKRSAVERKRILERTQGACFYCERTLQEGKWEVDHVWPLSQDGRDEFINLVPSCSKCNIDKGWGSPFHYLYEKWKSGQSITKYELNFLNYYSNHDVSELTKSEISFSEFKEQIPIFVDFIKKFPSGISMQENDRKINKDQLDNFNTYFGNYKNTSYQEKIRFYGRSGIKVGKNYYKLDSNGIPINYKQNPRYK